MSSSKSYLKVYVAEVREQLGSGRATELSYYPALQNLIKRLNPKVRVTCNPKSVRRKGKKLNKVDFEITRGPTPLGFIEAKNIGADLEYVQSDEQLRRYGEEFENLILTDYITFRRFVKGELRDEITIATVKEQNLVLTEDGEKKLSQFFKDFLTSDTFSVKSSNALASHLATYTRQIRKLVRQDLSEERHSKSLHKLMGAFKQVLLRDLDENKFSDMFAQTLTYGIFAARIHHDGKSEFSRLTVGNILPPTNKFMRRLFTAFVNDHLPDSIATVADDVVNLLKKTDVGQILKELSANGKDDAVVHFYESFLKAYDPNLQKKMGVYYTPDPIVTYMTRSVDDLLKRKFSRKLGLADEKTLILDPALGTGSFVKKVIDEIHEAVPPGKWDGYVSDILLQRVFGFEIMMAPYAVAHLKLGLQLQDTGYTFDRDERLGVYLTNTLEDTAKKSKALFGDWISEEANEAGRVKRDLPIMVVIGNPPYSYSSSNNGKWIRDLLHGYDSISRKQTGSYFQCDGEPLRERNPKGLNDDYVKFIRFAQWRVEQTGSGIVAFITNHGFLENITFRGMRDSLMQDFDEIYVLDLHGSSKKKEVSRQGAADENVFNIQAGVCISFLIRHDKKVRAVGSRAKVFRADLFGTREFKFSWLLSHSFKNTEFREVRPAAPDFGFVKQSASSKAEFNSSLSLPEIFPIHSAGIATFRDSLVVDFTESELMTKLKKFKDSSESDARENFGLGDDSRDWTIEGAQDDLRNSGLSKDLVTPILYRPFDMRFTYFTGNGKGLMATPRTDVMRHMLNQKKNLSIISTRGYEVPIWDHVMVADTIITNHSVSIKETNYAFPLYLIDEETKKKNNGSRAITPNLSKKVRDHLDNLYGKDSINPEQILSYIYATLHSQSFRDRYSAHLKVDFPRIQFPRSIDLFKKIAALGAELIELHTLKDDRLKGGKATFNGSGSNKVDEVNYDAKKEHLYINKTKYFDKVTPETFAFQVGGYKVLEKWLKERKGRKLSYSDQSCFEEVIEAVNLTIKIMAQIESVLDSSGGWPLSKKAA